MSHDLLTCLYLWPRSGNKHLIVKRGATWSPEKKSIKQSVSPVLGHAINCFVQGGFTVLGLEVVCNCGLQALMNKMDNEHTNKQMRIVNK